jgi:hypothetical protein
MRSGSVEGKGVVYDELGRPILQEHEHIVRSIPNDNLDVSEAVGFAGMRSIFDASAERGVLYITSRRVLYVREPNAVLAAKRNLYPVGMADALADAYKARVLERLDAREFCEIAYDEVEGFWVKRRTYGVLFLKSPSRGTRKAIMYQRGSKDDKFVVLKELLRGRLHETEPEDRNGTFLLGQRSPFLGRRK